MEELTETWAHGVTLEEIATACVMFDSVQPIVKFLPQKVPKFKGPLCWSSWLACPVSCSPPTAAFNMSVL